MQHPPRGDPVDEYRAFAQALSDAVARHRDPARRLRAGIDAYRPWALAQPHWYRMLFAASLPGYDAHSQRLVAASQAAMNVLLEVLGQAGPGEAGDSSARLERQLERWARDRGLAGVDPHLAQPAIVIWARLHGLVSHEIEGNVAAMGVDAALLVDAAIGD